MSWSLDSEPSPSLIFTFPPRHIFNVFNSPNLAQEPASPTPQSFSWDRPFNISPDLYRYTLDFKFPLYGILLYVTIGVVLNIRNRLWRNRPWAVSQTRKFYLFTLAHNLGLCIFSAWVFAGEIKAIHDSLPSTAVGPYYTHVADALCSVKGKRGLPSSSLDPIWPPQTSEISNLPFFAAEADSLWELGVGIFGWIFYMSKFYELIDSLLILAKGKNASLLQLYHHTGIILCTWASARYMTPPILVGHLFNSAIHTTMYCYIFLTTLRIRVPIYLKRALTALQITQFVLRAAISLSSVFIAFDVPIPFESDQGEGKTYTGELARSVRIHCMGTAAQALPLFLTVTYLVPLTFLFARLFVTSYILPAKKKVQEMQKKKA